ncbi:MAG: hypothetical protein ABW352_25370 [Polyangiales bacterium]
MKNIASRRASVGLLALAFTLSQGCAAEVAHEEAEATQPEAHEFRAPPPSLRVELPVAANLAGEGTLAVTVSNDVALAGEVTLDVYVTNESGRVVHADALRARVPASGERVVLLPVDSLSLPGEASVLRLDAAIVYSDGSRRRASAEGRHVEPRADGWWLHREGVPRGFVAAARRIGDAAGGAAGEKAAESVLICVNIVTNYLDHFAGDFFTESGDFARPAYGMKFRLQGASSTPIAEGNLLDGSSNTKPGCIGRTLSLQTNTNYALTLWSEGKVSGNAVVAQEAKKVQSVTLNISVPAGTGGLAVYDLDPNPLSRETAWNVYEALAYSLGKHPGFTPLKTVFDIAPTGGGAYTCETNSVSFESGLTQFKYIIGHELGHAWHFTNAGYVGNCSLPAQDYTDRGNGNVPGSVTSNDCNSPPPSGASDSHGLFSREWSSAAVVEGFANFYSAAVWNDATQRDCEWSQLADTVRDCEGDTSLPDRLMLTQCEQPSAGWARDRGNEWDWLKVLWDVHTDMAPRPTMNEILRWIRTAGEQGVRYTRSNYYLLLDDRALRIGGSLWRNWEAARFRNGVNGAPLVVLEAGNGKLVTANAFPGLPTDKLFASVDPAAEGPREQFEIYTANLGNGDNALVNRGSNGWVQELGGELSADGWPGLSPGSPLADTYSFTTQLGFDSLLSFSSLSSGRWVSAELATDASLTARASTVGASEKFTLLPARFPPD